jgi:hypothetical protein
LNWVEVEPFVPPKASDIAKADELAEPERQQSGSENSGDQTAEKRTAMGAALWWLAQRTEYQSRRRMQCALRSA